MPFYPERAFSESAFGARVAAFANAMLFTALVCAPSLALAHKASDAYLQLRLAGDTLSVRWDISLRDLDAVLDLDSNGDRKLSWGEVKSRMDDIQAYAQARLQLQRGRCSMVQAQPPAIEDRIDGAYLVLQLQANCDPRPTLEVDYRLFREVDPTHRGLLRIEAAADLEPVLQSLDPAGGPVTVAWPGGGGSAGPAAAPARSATFFRDGVHHLVIGYDHVLFLISLLLPAVLRRRDGGWEPVTNWREAVWPMVATVTMFTIAHSITLALAGLQLVTLSPRIIEPGIALTIMVAALDNLHPLLRGRRKLFTFLFGLIHGFGFAGVLSELDLPVSGFVVALLQFNLGVEAGQLLIVTVALVVLFSLREWKRYPSVILRGGSILAVVIASIWLAERVTDAKLLPI
ncbi:HupE/UreJ family protein [Variovorax sp. J22P271]|uniref:HupE/UreJ family protein n=1 Tax=Variovorax davisae TaxID=3053515 RepID=UPI00257697DF|nr:HupE/UreJ family protein [Variovorax sp. J22P271]MDM0032078.1 HupE/UreJ family protein [Variovorax sp. J22P271]